MHFTPKQKVTLFRLISRAADHQLPPDQIFMSLIKGGPVKIARASKNAQNYIDREVNFSMAGERSGFWSKSEAKLIKQAMDSDHLHDCADALSRYYYVRSITKSHLLHLAPFCLLLIVAAFMAPISGYMNGLTDLNTYLMYASIPIVFGLILVGSIDFFSYLSAKEWTRKLGIPQLLLKIPKVKDIHSKSEMGIFLEWCGMAQISGFEWEEAIKVAVQEVHNPIIRESLVIIAERVKSKDSVSDAISNCEYFPESAIEDLNEAQQDGQLAKHLMDINAKRIIRDNNDMQAKTSIPSKIMLITAIVLLAYAAYEYAKLRGLI